MVLMVIKLASKSRVRPMMPSWYGCCCIFSSKRNGGSGMAQCEVCGNEYDKAFEVVMAGRSHVFDSFECAIHALAPTCAHCGCAIIGHGVEAEGSFYCCAHCAEAQGVTAVRDRV
jgi:hypothetical protein